MNENLLRDLGRRWAGEGTPLGRREEPVRACQCHRAPLGQPGCLCPGAGARLGAQAHPCWWVAQGLGDQAPEHTWASGRQRGGSQACLGTRRSSGQLGSLEAEPRPAQPHFFTAPQLLSFRVTVPDPWGSGSGPAPSRPASLPPAALGPMPGSSVGIALPRDLGGQAGSAVPPGVEAQR